MNQNLKNIKVILATDCGSTTTKAILIEYINNEYRLTFRGEAPTTVEEAEDELIDTLPSEYEEDKEED